MKRFLSILMGVMLIAVLFALFPLHEASMQENENKFLRSEQSIAGQYIVVFEEGVAGVRGHASNADFMASELASQYGGRVERVFKYAVHGFSVEMDAKRAEALSRDPRVKYVEEDGIMSIDQTTQNSATWGLDRSDQRNLPLDSKYSYNYNGSGVNAYIIDTGIRYSHADLGSRARFGFDAFGGNGSDCNGHGTHVAGTTGGTAWGVAKGVSLVAVRVLDCNGSGTTSGVIAGVDWVTANHAKPAVANMSLGGGASSTLDTAVNNSINSGVTYAVAAGNGDQLGRQQDACNYSPARVPAAITISASNSSDAKASWANYGNCVDFFAPGVSITSAWYTSDTATSTISGTSMAAPHVAGAAALYLQANPSASPLAVRDFLYNQTTKNIITSSSTTNNHLMFTLWGGGGTTNNPPTASFTFSCTDLACSFNGTGSSDSDGSISGYSWNFGDGSAGSGSTVSRTYASGGTYTVTLTVTDNEGATDSESKTVTVSGGGSGITLSATGYKVKGAQNVDLTWGGATSTSVDVFRNSTKIITTANDGAYTDSINSRGGGSYTYKLCAAGTTTCSNSVTVTF
jgi:subtilisin family serine protease